MKVYILVENHKYEGQTTLGVFSSLLSEIECNRLGKERSSYKEKEREEFCKYRCIDWQIETPLTREEIK